MEDHTAARELIVGAIESTVRESASSDKWRAPLVGFVSAGHPRLGRLRQLVGPSHMLPGDLLEGARTVVSYFLPFAEWVVRANAADRLDVAREWAEAYRDTNAEIARINGRLIEALAANDVRAVAEPPTGKFDRSTLRSSWSHKSVAVIAGLGSFGVHHMVITDSGCAGRFGSLVIDKEVPPNTGEPHDRCRHRVSGGCLECVRLCPVGAIRPDGGLDRERCWARCQSVAAGFVDVGKAEVCGKCAVGPCALSSPM